MSASDRAIELATAAAAAAAGQARDRRGRPRRQRAADHHRHLPAGLGAQRPAGQGHRRRDRGGLAARWVPSRYAARAPARAAGSCWTTSTSSFTCSTPRSASTTRSSGSGATAPPWSCPSRSPRTPEPDDDRTAHRRRASRTHGLQPRGPLAGSAGHPARRRRPAPGGSDGAGSRFAGPGRDRLERPGPGPRHRGRNRCHDRTFALVRPAAARDQRGPVGGVDRIRGPGALPGRDRADPGRRGHPPRGRRRDLERSRSAGRRRR